MRSFGSASDTTPRRSHYFVKRKSKDVHWNVASLGVDPKMGAAGHSYFVIAGPCAHIRAPWKMKAIGLVAGSAMLSVLIIGRPNFFGTRPLQNYRSQVSAVGYRRGGTGADRRPNVARAVK
jgi:hypothetical protein